MYISWLLSFYPDRQFYKDSLVIMIFILIIASLDMIVISIIWMNLDRNRKYLKTDIIITCEMRKCKLDWESETESHYQFKWMKSILFSKMKIKYWKIVWREKCHWERRLYIYIYISVSYGNDLRGCHPVDTKWKEPAGWGYYENTANRSN